MPATALTTSAPATPTTPARSTAASSPSPMHFARSTFPRPRFRSSASAVGCGGFQKVRHVVSVGKEIALEGIFVCR